MINFPDHFLFFYFFLYFKICKYDKDKWYFLFLFLLEKWKIRLTGVCTDPEGLVLELKLNKHFKNGPQFSFDKYWVFFWSFFLKAKQTFCKNFIKLCKYLVSWSENFMPIKTQPFGLIVLNSYSWMAFRTTNNTRTEVNNLLCYTLFLFVLIGKQLFKPARLVWSTDS